ncbi:MAG: hypothetical protein ACRDZ3_10945 [Acidimicrobiia bacterium]
MTRVLIGGFGPIVAIGLRDLLKEGGYEVAEEVGIELVDHIASEPPEVVLINLDAGGDTLARDISSRFPEIKVVAFSSQRPTMRVFPPHHWGESYGSPLTVNRLMAAITTVDNQKRGM